MELCSDDLKNILQMKPQFFGRQNGEPMDLYEYFISCELFREILECVQYLHELDPQIIHRDLKPENILIDRHGRDGRFVNSRQTYKLDPQIIHRDLKPENILIDRHGRDGRFVKLCDFGLATVHDKRMHAQTGHKHTADVGDIHYMAPESNTIFYRFDQL
ncbi:unnamed protein product [Oppiella nova]|uniref:Protein kinase domain-containing protein n=1 Tax=Oppiella nova TaxID=334625 RepID=A0A7R9MK21_9ACAR|nr:unnamed protein product [Oppiella nova]CAG2178831.1 unnamed protein product [Oppiella nova]